MFPGYLDLKLGCFAQEQVQTMLPINHKLVT